MKSYELTVHWGANAIINVEADNLHDAVDKAYNSDLNNLEGRDQTVGSIEIFLEDDTEVTCLAWGMPMEQPTTRLFDALTEEKSDPHLK